MMTVMDFINSDDTLQDHIITEYALLEDKQNVAERIATVTYRDNRRDSVGRYMLTEMAYIELYTDLEVGENMLDAFNALNAEGIFEEMGDIIPAKEYCELRQIIDMACRDREYNENEPHNFVRTQVARFGELIGASLGPVMEGINWDELLSGLTPSSAATTEMPRGEADR